MTSTYGTVHFLDTDWALEVEPQVAARAKRVFPRMRQAAGTRLWLRATPENTRDLAWFMERYPLDIDAASRNALARLAAEHVRMEASIAELLAGRGKTPTAELAKPLRDYQREAWGYLQVRGGLLLGDAVGTGKTVTAIGPMADHANLPAVVVRPAYMPGHWEGADGKLAEFAPHLRVHMIDEGRPYPLVRSAKDRRRRADLWTELPDVIVVTYHMLRGWADVLAAIAVYVVFDEVQQLRHPNTEIYRAASQLARGERMNAAGQFETIMRQATGLAKAPFVAAFVRMLVESGEKVLVYGWHHAVYDVWRERWAKDGLKSVFYTGEESSKEKLQAKQEFVDGDAHILVMSLRSGAGVDGLQDVCSTVVFGELDWSPGVHEQCIGRVDRDLSDRHDHSHPNEQRATVAYFLTATDGCDPVMIDVLGVKREQLEGVRDPGGKLIERIDIGQAALRQLARAVLERRGEVLPAGSDNITAVDFTTATNVANHHEEPA